VARPKQTNEERGIFDKRRDVTPDGLAAQWALHPEAVQRWREYCPALTVETIEQRMLGYGTFPPYTSKCSQPRIMVPIFRGDRVVGFRGRLVGESCGKCVDDKGKPKCTRWLSPSGTQPVLYGAEDVVRAHRIDTLAICESPVEKLLLDQIAARDHKRMVAVATLGVGAWDDAWIKSFSKAGHIVVCYDNDPAGNGGSTEALREQWFAEHPKTNRDLVCGGARLANRLLAAGLKNVTLWPWPRDARVGADLRDVLKEAA
jgi:hypothetical protein